ncbi:Transcription initiation factor IIA subunit 1, variant 3 [Dermatophagoides farinae]|uniref:Transcription initiation factor IIA subunit 1, variant 3 n=1 Tax=Dermatophagoides farinae TaxID=6954 RepID=A0A922L540_DERFA|nr:Transcription initiation factor IIA subunit 1, variant 3 [Dermatophagoides farinae]
MAMGEIWRSGLLNLPIIFVSEIFTIDCNHHLNHRLKQQKQSKIHICRHSSQSKLYRINTAKLMAFLQTFQKNNQSSKYHRCPSYN